MHPSGALLLWGILVVCIQFTGYASLAILGLWLLSMPACFKGWWAYIRRSRWLLLSLWLILAYQTPGDAFADLAWAPTDQGMVEATRQAARLLVMLGLLAWLQYSQGRNGLVGGLWGLCFPLRLFGVETERLVVRLSLVFENVQHSDRRADWKKMLHEEAAAVGGSSVIQLDLPHWRSADTLILLLAMLFCWGMMSL